MAGDAGPLARACAEADLEVEPERGNVCVCLSDWGEKFGSSSWKVEERDSVGGCRLMRRRPETPSTLSLSAR